MEALARRQQNEILSGLAIPVQVGHIFDGLSPKTWPPDNKDTRELVTQNNLVAGQIHRMKQHVNHCLPVEQAQTQQTDSLHVEKPATSPSTTSSIWSVTRDPHAEIRLVVQPSSQSTRTRDAMCFAVTMEPGRKCAREKIARIQKTRPAHIDMNAVREGVARGSLTSLSDLILRASQVVSNLELGKTASRIGPEWLQNVHSEEIDHTKELTVPSVSPSPSSAEFLSENDGPQRGVLSLPITSTACHDQIRTRKRPFHRRCCGMPLWAFLLVYGLLSILAATVIIVPVVLLTIVPSSTNHGLGGT